MKTKSIPWLPVGLFFLFGGIYQASITRQFSYDGLCYALDVAFAPLTNLFHPNHLLYSFVSWCCFRGSQILGYNGPAIFLMQSVNVLVGAAAVAFLGWSLSRRWGMTRGILGAALFGLSNAFWSESTDPGCYAWAALATVLLLELLLSAESLHPLWVGIAHGVLTLFHEMLILVVPAFLWRFHRSRKNILLYLTGFGTAVIIPYAVVATVFHGDSLRETFLWVLGPAGPPPGTGLTLPGWWSTALATNTRVAWHAFVGSLIAPSVQFCRVAEVALAVGLIVVVRQSERTPKARHETAPLILWVLTMNAFQFFYYTGALRFRILFLAPLAALLAASMETRRRSVFALAGVLILCIGWWNFRSTIQPRRQSGTDAERTAWIVQELTPRDFLIFSGDGSGSVINVYMAYFAHDIPARSLKGYLYSHPDGNMQELIDGLQQAQRLGGRLWVEKDLLDPVSTDRMEAAHHLPIGTLQRWRGLFKPVAVVSGPGDYQLVQVRI